MVYSVHSVQLGSSDNNKYVEEISDACGKKLYVRSVLILHNPNCFRVTLPLSSSSHMCGGSPGAAEKYLITVVFKFKVIKSNY